MTSGNDLNEVNGVEESAQASETDKLRLLLDQLRELKDSSSYFATAKTDSVKFAIRKALLSAVIGVLGIVAAAGLLVFGIWFLLRGISSGLEHLYPHQAWIGPLGTGIFVLAGLGLAVAYALAKNRALSKRTEQKYQALQARQRAEFGRDVHDLKSTYPH